MNYEESVKLIDFINSRMRPLGWHRWAVDLSWAKLQRWAKSLGYVPKVKEESK